MERFCDKCGSFVNGDVKFCPVCGAQMKSAVDLGKTEQQVQPNYGYGNQPNGTSRQNNGYGARIVWGFGSATPEPKRSFCRAMIVVNIISSVLAIIAAVILFSVFGDEISQYKYYFRF